MMKLFSKREFLFELATKTEDPSLVKHDLETWLREVITQNDTILKRLESTSMNVLVSIEHLNRLRQPLQKTSIQSKHRVQKRRDSREHLVNDKETC